MSLPTPAATPTPPEQLPRPSSTREMQLNDEQPTEHQAVASGRPRRHSIHSTSPTMSDQQSLPDLPATKPPAADPEQEAAAPVAQAERTGRPLESFDSLYEAISTIPVEQRDYQLPPQMYYPIGGPSNPPGLSPTFAAGQWGSPPPSRSFGQGMQAFSHPEGTVGQGERRLGRCKFFNALKGFGFILDHRGEELGPDVEVFVHYSAIQAVQGSRGGFKSLMENEEVEYTIAQGAKGWQAQDVTGPNGAPVIGTPSSGPKSPAQTAFDRKFSVGSIGSDDFRSNGYNAQRTRGSIGGTDSGYYSSAMTSPVHTPHQLYSPPQYQTYPLPPPHANYGPPPMGMPLGLHQSNGYSFIPPPPFAHPALPDGASPPTIPLPLFDPTQNGRQFDRGPDPYQQLPPNAFFQSGPPPFPNGHMPPPMQGYYGSPPEGYYIPQEAYGFSPPFPPPLPLPTGVGAAGIYSDGSPDVGSCGKASSGEKSPESPGPGAVREEKPVTEGEIA